MMLDKAKQVCSRVWLRLKGALGRSPKTPEAEACEPPAPSRADAAPAVEAPPAPQVQQPEIKAELSAPPAAESETDRALLKPPRWTAGTARNEAGRLMPWVFVPPERKFRLFIPANAPEPKRRAMVMMVHGCRQDAETFARGTRFNEVAEQHGFVVLYPDQADIANAQRCWNWFETRTLAGKGEAAILLSMIEQAVRRAQVDPERVVIAGLSSGAALAALLAYQQPARFAGVVVHSGVPPYAAHSVRTALEAMRHGAKLDLRELTQRYWAAQQLPPPPLRVIHGDADTAVHPDNAHALFELWASLRQAEVLDPLAREQRIVSAAGARSYELTTLRSDRELVAERILVHGLGHAWSGGDAALPFNDASRPSASALIAQWVERVAALESDVR